jgi:hypothetical protein
MHAGRKHLVTLSVNGRIILKELLEEGKMCGFGLDSSDSL